MKNGSDRHKRSVRGELSRSHILAAAADAFSELGPEAVTMRHVARMAGVNIATLLYHFPSKDDLFAEVVSMMKGGKLAIVTAWRAMVSDESLSRLDSLKETLTDLGVLIIDRVIADPARLRLGLFSALEVSGQRLTEGTATEGIGSTLSPSPEKDVVRAVLARAVELGTLACGCQEIDDYIEGSTYLSRGFAVAHIREISAGAAGRDAVARRFRQIIRRYIHNMLPGTPGGG